MVSPKSVDVRRRLEEAFHAFGMPRFMLSDGGPPFGANGLGRLSRLGVWLVRLGVIPVLIEPGRPDQRSEWAPRAVPRDPESGDGLAAEAVDPRPASGHYDRLAKHSGVPRPWA